MKKRCVFGLILLFLVLFSFSVLAQTGNETVEEKAYSCIESRVIGKCSTLPFEDRVFALLALGYHDVAREECRLAIDSSRNCWPMEDCKVKETAQAVVALSNLGIETVDAETWLNQKTRTPDKILWYLQVDTNTNSTCKVTYGDRDYNLRISADKKLSMASNRCLKVSDYWLAIDKECFDETFKVTCDADFITSLIYKTATSNTIFVSGNLEAASGNGETQHKVEAKCFGDSTLCSYPASLWATYAMLKLQKDITPYLPYLFAFAEENEKSGAYAFLYVFTAEDEYRSRLINQQNPQGYWNFNSGKGKFYDTANALMAFQTELEYSTVIENVKEYLSGSGIQSAGGCWANSVRDTSFLLWTLWPKATAIQATQQQCEESGLFCMTEGECSSLALGNIVPNYYCPGGILKVCCDKALPLLPCVEQGGVVCPAAEPCTTSTVAASDAEECCLTQCQAPVEANECESAGYSCKAICSENEESVFYACEFADDVCCRFKPEEPKSRLWIYVLILMIVVVALAIIFRNRLKLILYKMRRRGPAPAAKPAAGKPRPPFGGAPQYPRTQSRPAAAAQPQRPSGGVSSELQETLKKLREIGK